MILFGTIFQWKPTSIAVKEFGSMCYHCYEEGHWQTECPKKPENQVCHYCLFIGHRKSECKFNPDNQNV